MGDIICTEVLSMAKREMPGQLLSYVPTPGDREKRCRGFDIGRNPDRPRSGEKEILDER